MINWLMGILVIQLAALVYFVCGWLLLKADLEDAHKKLKEQRNFYHAAIAKGDKEYRRQIEELQSRIK